MQEKWSAVDRYLSEKLACADPVLDACLRANAAAGLPAIDVSAPQGKFLHLLATIQGARRILEIGTLGGYSTIWFARALPADGQIVTLELNPDHARVARANFARAQVESKVQLIEGDARASLARLHAEQRGPFDLIFIDADKPSTPAYLGWALKLARPGTVIVCDNVVRNGAVVDAQSTDESVIGVRKLIDLVSTEPRLSATALQTVGIKGYDGFLVARVVA